MAKTNWQMDDTVMPADLNQIGHEINELKADGTTTDDRIGDRTINDATTPASNTGKLTSLLSGLANIVKSITGEASWRTMPSTTIKAIKATLDAATNTAAVNTMIKRDANGRAKVAAPSANDDIARKAEVDAAQATAISTAASDATGKSNTVQANLDSHAGDTVKHITAAERTNWNAKATTSIATTSANGLMSSIDKSKLDGIAAGANNYVHPATHSPGVITQDANNRFVTDTEKAAWNAKETVTGSQSKADAAQAAAAIDATSKVNAHAGDAVMHITAAERAAWNAKAPTTVATISTNGLMSSTDKSKLDGIATGANNYVHPATHPASIIVQDANNRFVTDAEKTAWNAKASTAQVTATAAGLMSSAHYSKLEGIAIGANNYTHPSGDGNQHVPATGTTNNAKVLKAGATAGSAAWGNVAFSEVTSKPTTLAGYGITDAVSSAHIGSGGTAHAAATTSAAGFMSVTDKSKLDGIAAGAQVNPGVATTTTTGLMSATDKSKLDGVSAGANNYMHPATHPPSIIAQDANNRFVTDTEKATWNGKASTAVATTSSHGLMSSVDKGKLDGIVAGAQVNRVIATQAQAVAGTDNTTDMTPLRTIQAIDSRNLYGITAGTATAYTLTFTVAPASLYTGLQVTIKLHVATGTNPTLNINGLGAKALYDGDGARFSGESGKIYSFVYDGTNFILYSGGGGGKLNVYSNSTSYPTSGNIQGVRIGSTVAISNIVFTDNVWNAGEWKPTLSNLVTPDSNRNSASVYHNGYIYFLGGLSSTSVTGRVTRLDVNTGVTTSMASLPSGKFEGHTVLYNNKIYYIGGQPLNDYTAMSGNVYIYDIATNVWSNGSSLIQPVGGTGYTLNGGYIYVAGGTTAHRSTSTFTNRLQRYDIANNSWQAMASLPYYTSGGALAAWNGNLLLFGPTAYSGSSDTSTTVSRNGIYSYSITGNTWTTLSTTLTYDNVNNRPSNNGVVLGKYLYYATSIYTLSNGAVKIALDTLELTNIGNSYNEGYRGIVHITQGGVEKLVAHGSSANSYAMREIALTPVSLPNNCAVIMRSDNRFGAYYTEFVTTNKANGAFSSFLTGFDDVHYHNNGVVNRNLTTYYGDGTKWVQFK